MDQIWVINRMSHNWWFIMMSHRVTSNVWKSAKMGISKLVVSILGCNTFIFGLNLVGFMYDSVLMTSEWLINDDVIQRLRHKRDSSCESEAMPNHGQEKTLSHWWITIDDVIMSHDNDVIGHVTEWRYGDVIGEKKEKKVAHQEQQLKGQFSMTS